MTLTVDKKLSSTPQPSADKVAGEVQNTMDDSGQQTPDHIVDVVVAEVIRAADDPRNS